MSFNQSMSDKNETQYRKTGRSKSSNQQHRGFSPAYPAGAGAGDGGPATSISSNRSLKKSNYKAQGGQSNANVTNLNPSDAGASETTVTFAPPKQTEPSVPQRSSRSVPTAPASLSAFWAEEQAKQRQLKAILNKRITPQNLKKMIERVKAVNIDNAITLTGVVSQIYDKALMEPTFCEMYADLCFHLAAELPDVSEDNEKINFKRLLLNKCQEEFERGEREQEEANKVDEEGEVKQSEEESKEKRIKARRRMLGNIRLIGELYKKKMLTERIMHECIKKLLGQQQTPDEEDIEALCKLMSTIGEMIDHPKAKEHMDAYFERMESLSNNMRLSSRVRFMLKDTIDLRKNRWQQRRKVEGPKKIEEVHRDAAQERQAQASRLGRGPGINPSARRGASMDFRGILPGPIAGSQGGMQRNNPDADRWQRATNFQPKGLMPSPQTPLQVMHRAERKYEIGKVSDEEQAKQRQLKAILNKLTPQNFEKLFEQVKAVNIDNATTLTGVISQIFDKALMEPTFCEMYANFCFHLAAELPDFSEDNEKITFKRLLLNKCQEEFERGEREQEEANKVDEEGEVKQSEEESEEKRIKARRRMLGNIRLIGELYKKQMLTERIMHECIKKLLGQQQTPDEEDIEALCKLMSTIGEMIDHPKAKEHMDAYFERMESLSNNMRLSSRVRFMLKDTIDLRKNRWQQRRKVEGPKVCFTPQIGPQLPQLGNLGISIAAQYPQQQGGKFAGPCKIPFKMTHPDTNEELRLDKRAYYPVGGSSAARTHPSVSQSQSIPSYATSHPTSYYTHSYNPIPLFFPSPNLHPLTSSHMPANSQGAALTQNVHLEKSEEQLRDMALGAIKEFYSARDEKEVALCIKELNSPSFHPSMISLWVTDSFERKDVERDLLAKLLVNLTKSQDGTLSQSQLIKGFEIILSILEDAVIDAPRAQEFLGLILAKVILENVVSLNQIGQLIHEGGEEPGHLLEVGLAGNVLGNILEIIKSEKGESLFRHMW